MQASARLRARVCSFGERMSTTIAVEILKHWGVASNLVESKDFLVSETNPQVHTHNKSYHAFSLRGAIAYPAFMICHWCEKALTNWPGKLTLITSMSQRRQQTRTSSSTLTSSHAATLQLQMVCLCACMHACVCVCTCIHSYMHNVHAF